MSGNLAIQDIGQPRVAASGIPELARHAEGNATFEVYQTERVSMTSVLHSGDDWRWRFRSAAGTVMVNSEAYPSERACRAAVAALQNDAGAAKLTRQSWCHTPTVLI